jgi:hypothetical protein
VPSVAMPALPFSTLKFSALIDRVTAGDSRDKFPRPIPKPLNDAICPPQVENLSVLDQAASELSINVAVEAAIRYIIISLIVRSL